MEPLLDETSLTPCSQRAPAERISCLAQALGSLDEIGFPPVLRAVRAAADVPLSKGQSLRYWFFEAGTDRDAGLLVADRLSKQPFLDGDDGLFAAKESTGAIEARVGGSLAIGLGYAALAGGLVVILSSAARPAAERLEVELTHLDDAGVRTTKQEVATFATSDEVTAARDALVDQLHRSVSSGQELIGRIGELFPRIQLSDPATAQISALTGNEPYFQLLIRHLRELDGCARTWRAGTAFEPTGMPWSVESQQTLKDKKFGPMRDFAMPDGFAGRRWSLHSKLTGGAGARLYFEPVQVGKKGLEKGVVLIGYFGSHLPTKKYPT